MKAFLDKRAAKVLRPVDVIATVRLILNVARPYLSSVPPDNDVVLHVSTARTRIGLIAERLRPGTKVNVYAYVNPRGDRAAWADRALVTLANWYAQITLEVLTELRAELRDALKLTSIAGPWLAPVKPKKREPSKSEKLLEAEERVHEWESKLKDATRSQRLARTKLKGYRAKLRTLRASLTRTEQTRELNEGDFATLMRLKRERGQLKETAA